MEEHQEEEQEDEEEEGEVSKLINLKENKMVRINISSEGMAVTVHMITSSQQQWDCDI